MRWTLKRFLRRRPRHRRIYEILSELLPPPEEIVVETIRQFVRRIGMRIGRRVLGFTLRERREVFLRRPRDLSSFTHELIHLCEKPVEGIHEETWASLAPLIVWMAEAKIEGRPLHLLTLSEEEVNSVLRGFKLESIEDYYNLRGLIPITHAIDLERGVIVRRREMDWRMVLFTFISELMGDIPYYRILRGLLSLTLKK